MTFSEEWDKVHKDRDWCKYPNERLVFWTAQNFGMVPVKFRRQIKLLDVGCAQGASTIFLSKEGYSVTAMDGSIHAATKLKDNLLDENCSAEVVCGDFTKIPYPDAYFNGVIDIVSVAHNNNYQEIFKEILRVTKKGGRIFSILPAVGTCEEPFTGFGEIQYFEKEQIRRCFGVNASLVLSSWRLESEDARQRLYYWLVEALRI